MVRAVLWCAVVYSGARVCVVVCSVVLCTVVRACGGVRRCKVVYGGVRSKEDYTQIL